ncbi:MAG TPA: methyltransferase domain-containing protein [Phycisphaerae bacterium]|nr:methyltransferase domain-containing protein [Phycisphaerae bacterium]HRY69788.1 methyltransferase domain-containing protein [Phycisphaerae bacterium]HSA25379.1 methyltransferase domain-containing protein [Phycisphaerae bacterium]
MLLLASVEATSAGTTSQAASQGKNTTGPAGAQATRPAPTRPADRAAAVRSVAARLGLGKGDVVADIGAGNGQDSWVFAEIVGRSGVVYAEEITDELVKSLKDKAKEKRLSQVRAVRGQVDDLGQIEALDVAYMRYVYHHFSKPREMLRAIWRALKPGGYLVVVDREPGTLKDWAPREERKDKHHWTGETTVVREAREEGFRVVGCAEDCCESLEPFVLIFQRPKGIKVPGGDPDPILRLPIQEIAGQFMPLSRPYERPVFIAMGQARELMLPIMQRSTGRGLDIVLEEWATQKDERPSLPLGLSMPCVLTTNGDPGLSTEPIDVVFFLDSYHLLFQGNILLATLRERLRPDGCVYILDRVATRPLSRREASHHRQIDPRQVKEEMAAAGYSLWFEGPPPAPDRFLQIYGIKHPKEVRPETDPFVVGGLIDGSPEEWLRNNRWRLRGVKSADGRCVSLPAPTSSLSIEKTGAKAAEMETWRLPAAKVELLFKKTDRGYLLVNCLSVDGR